MSNFYYCNDCKKPVDLKRIDFDKGHIWIGDYILLCKECGSNNWDAMIDSPGGYPKIHPGSTHRMGDIEKLNKGEK